VSFTSNGKKQSATPAVFKLSLNILSISCQQQNANFMKFDKDLCALWRVAKIKKARNHSQILQLKLYHTLSFKSTKVFTGYFSLRKQQNRDKLSENGTTKNYQKTQKLPR